MKFLLALTLSLLSSSSFAASTYLGSCYSSNFQISISKIKKSRFEVFIGVKDYSGRYVDYKDGYENNQGKLIPIVLSSKATGEIKKTGVLATTPVLTSVVNDPTEPNAKLWRFSIHFDQNGLDVGVFPADSNNFQPSSNRFGCDLGLVNKLKKAIQQ